MSANVVSLWALHDGRQMLVFACPGCGHIHGPYVKGRGANGAAWTWNGDLVRPSIQPSILAQFELSVCHSHVTDGRILFHSDSTHALAGRLVDLPPVELEGISAGARVDAPAAG